MTFATNKIAPTSSSNIPWLELELEITPYVLSQMVTHAGTNQVKR